VPVRLLLAAVLLLVTGVAAAPATAESEPGQLVIEGQGNTTTELVLDGEVFLRGLEPPVISGGGDYAGVLIERAAADWRAPQVVGGVQVRAFADGTQDATAVLGYANSLPEGRYRVTLLGEGPVRASFALAERAAPGLTVVPRERIPVRFHHRSEPLAVGPSTAAVALDRALPPGRRALQVALLRDAAVGAVRMCATAAAQCEGPSLGRLAVPLPGQPFAFASLVAPADEARSLLWASTGARAAEDRLRAAALVF
jgi:hypothetical protein